MAGDYRKINTMIWSDSGWRSLSPAEQWLYMALLTHPTISYVGVLDWRPAKLSGIADGVTAADLRRLAATLQQKRFILIDEDREECLVRSFIKYDGVLKNQNLGKSIARDFAATYSDSIRRVVVHEMNKLIDRAEERYATLVNKHSRPLILEILENPAAPIEEFITPPDTPGDTTTDTPSHTPSDTGSQNGRTPHGTPPPTPGLRGGPTPGGGRGSPPSPTPAPPPTAVGGSKGEAPVGPRAQETPIPDDWGPKDTHLQRAKKKHLDVREVADSFRAHAETHDRRAANWDAAFTKWLIGEPAGSPAQRSSFDPWTASHDDYLHPEERAEIERRSRTQNAPTASTGAGSDDAF